LRHELPRVELVWADQGYTGAFAEWLRETRGWRLEVVRHADRQLVRYRLVERPTRTFRVLPRRWVVERTFTWLGRARRLSKDYERLPAVSEAMIYGATSRLMLRRLTRSAAYSLARPKRDATGAACRGSREAPHGARAPRATARRVPR
jgi:putative transposase